MFKFTLKKKKMINFTLKLSEPMWALIVRGATMEKVDESEYMTHALASYSMLRDELAVNKDSAIGIIGLNGEVKKIILLPK